MQDTPLRPRRRHSSALKAEILLACRQPGASVARVALDYGVNANLVHRWRRQAEASDRGHRGQGEVAAFVPLTVSRAPAVTASDEIRIELRRGACAVSIAWPTSAAAACAGWLRELVK